jgi:hypothetical protein
MATRQERIDAFTHERVPPADQPLELLCEDHVGTYVVPFLCRWSSGAWHSVDTGSPIEATVIGWRVTQLSPLSRSRPCKVEIQGRR